MENLTIIDTLTHSQLIESGLATKQAKRFGQEHSLSRTLDSWSKYNPIWYVVKSNSKHNYGTDFQLWASYTADRINFFKLEQFSGSSSLTSSGLHRVFFNNSTVSFSEEAYDKSRNSRPALRRASNAGYIFA